MRRLTKLGIIGTLSLFSLVYLGSGVFAQQTSNDQSTLTLNEVKQRLKENQQYLKDAQKQGKAGDAQGLQTALENYDRNMDGINTALSQGHVSGTPAQQESVYQRVENATSKHTKVLENLLSKVPEQARAHIQHAIDVSQTGHNTALNNLQKLQAQQGMGRGNHPGFGGPEGGRPEGAGRLGGGMGEGNVGGGMGGGMGHAGGMGGGRR